MQARQRELLDERARAVLSTARAQRSRTALTIVRAVTGRSMSDRFARAPSEPTRPYPAPSSSRSITLTTMGKSDQAGCFSSVAMSALAVAGARVSSARKSAPAPSSIA